MMNDDRPLGPGGERRGMERRPSRTSARDLERYAGLFAARTRVMKSSAMRDMMAITRAAGGDPVERRDHGRRPRAPVRADRRHGVDR